MIPFRREATLIQTIPGIIKTTASAITAEISVNMSQVPTAAHLEGRDAKVFLASYLLAHLVRRPESQMINIHHVDRRNYKALRLLNKYCYGCYDWM
jgi:hypothetical protein